MTYLSISPSGRHLGRGKKLTSLNLNFPFSNFSCDVGGKLSADSNSWKKCGASRKKCPLLEQSTRELSCSVRNCSDVIRMNTSSPCTGWGINSWVKGSHLSVTIRHNLVSRR